MIFVLVCEDMRKILSEMKAVGSVEPGIDAEVGNLPLPLTSTDTPIAPPAENWLGMVLARQAIAYVTNLLTSQEQEHWISQGQM